MRFKRGPIDSAVRDSMGIDAGERIIAWGIGTWSPTEPSYVVATDEALYDQRGPARYPWADVIKGTWQEPQFVLTLDSGPGAGAIKVAVRVDDPRDLPAAVRDRVTDTVVVSEYVDLGDEAGAQLVARRDPGAGLEGIRWSIVFDSGLDPGDPDLRARADRALADLRGSLGI